MSFNVHTNHAMAHSKFFVLRLCPLGGCEMLTLADLTRGARIQRLCTGRDVKLKAVFLRRPAEHMALAGDLSFLNRGVLKLRLRQLSY